MNPLQAWHEIRDACRRRPELRHKNYDEYGIGVNPIPNLNPMLGFCYVATEVFCHLVPEARPYKHKELDHIFAKIGDEVWDLTMDQYDFVPDYENSYRRNRRPLTKRGQLLLEEVRRVI